MSRNAMVWLVAFVLAVAPAPADELLHRYEGDVHPLDPSTGWIVGNTCDNGCFTELDTENGYFVMYWPEPGDVASYAYRIAEPPDPAPPSLWVEWRFRSNHAWGQVFSFCDGVFSVDYGGIGDTLYMYGDSVISFRSDDFVLGLDMNEFHTYRFESFDGINYTFAVDGLVFVVEAQNLPNGYHTLQFGGKGGCIDDSVPNQRHEWDAVQFGTLSDGALIVATDPPQGTLDPATLAALDRFTVTFDQPAYVYLDDITVSGSEAAPPQVIATQRRDNGEPEVLEFLLDRALIPDETVTFTFDDGATVNEVTYTYSVDPYVPAVSEWGLTVMVLLVLVSGSLLLRTRAACDP